MSTPSAAPDYAAPDHEARVQVTWTPEHLASLTRRMAALEDLWRAVVHHHPDGRQPVCLVATEGFELWVIGWTEGQGLDLHDHGGAHGAFTVVEGILTETSLGDRGLVTHRRGPGTTRPLPATTIHSLDNRGAVPATSIHAYSPRLTTMSHYESFTGALLRTDTFPPVPPALPPAVAPILLGPGAR